MPEPVAPANSGQTSGDARDRRVTHIAGYVSGRERQARGRSVADRYDRYVPTERGFEKFGFFPSFDARVDPEFPSDGDWRCDVFGFSRSGQVEPEFQSVWGTPMVVEVTSTTIERWVGNFAAGGLGGVTGLFATPGPFEVCAVVDGLALVVDVRRPDLGATPVCDQVAQVVATPRGDLLLLVSFFDIVAVGPTGVAWRSGRLAADDLRVVKVSGSVIECRCSLGGPDADEILVLDVLTGKQTAGTRLQGFWPPEALA